MGINTIGEKQESLFYGEQESMKIGEKRGCKEQEAVLKSNG